MKRSHTAAGGQEAQFTSVTMPPVPAHLLANPLPGREHEYTAPAAAWLHVEQPVRLATDTPPPGATRVGSNVSPDDMQRAADFLWTLNCRFEKPQFSVLLVRKPFPPRLSQYLHRFRHSSARSKSPSCDIEPQS